jgi:methionine aminopeptidase
VLVDTGCTIEGYHSDITRTYAFGAVSQDIRDIWAIEKEAQQAAFDAVRPGETCESVDNAARAVLVRAGLGPDYALPGLPIAPAMASACRSTNRPIWCAATAPCSNRGCASRTSR